MNHSRKTRLVFFAAIILFISGCLFQAEQLQLLIVRLANHSLGISLDEHFRCIGLSYLSTFLLLSGSICFTYLARLKNKLSELNFYVISVSLLLFHYFYYLFLNAKNFPVFDDQGALLDFLVRYSNASSAAEKIKLIVSPYNESILFFPKLFVLCCAKIFGGINFRDLILFNGLLLLFLYLFLFLKMKSNSTPLFIFFVLGVFLFQFQYFDDAFWAISGLCYYGAFIFTALAFYFLLQLNSRGIFLALVCSFIATFTFGNGWITFPICILFLLLKKRYVELRIWIIAFIPVLAVYFFFRSEFHPLVLANWNPLDNISFILIFLGSAFQFFYFPYIPLVVGAFIVLSFIFLILKKYYRTSPFHFLVLSFLICSAIVAAPFRSGIEPHGLYGLHVRYGIFSILAFVLTVFLLYGYADLKKKYAVYLIASAFAYNALTGIFFFPEVVIRGEKIQTIIAGIRENKFDVKYSTFRKDDIEILLREAIKKGIYNP